MNKQYDIMDIINVMSFWIGIQNLDENLSQGKAADMLGAAVGDIHDHLKEQDDKINHILEVLTNDNR